MSDRIRSLLQRVASSEASSDPVDAELRDRLPAAARGVAALEREIASEIAYSLGKAAKKLEASIARALAAQSALDAADLDAAARQRLVARFNEERALAERHLRDLMIQREALGIRRHAELLKLYPLPPRLPSE